MFIAAIKIFSYTLRTRSNSFSCHLTKYRISGIEKAEIEYYKQLTQTLEKLEEQKPNEAVQ